MGLEQAGAELRGALENNQETLPDPEPLGSGVHPSTPPQPAFEGAYTIPGLQLGTQHR